MVSQAICRFDKAAIRKLPDHSRRSPEIRSTTKVQTLLEITGTDDPNEWKDVALQLYVDPDVKYGGQKIGGIRIRKPAPVPVPVQKPELVQEPF